VEEPQAEDVGPFYASSTAARTWGTPGGAPPRLTLVKPPQDTVPEDREDGGTA